jgi:hypothetical protein
LVLFFPSTKNKKIKKQIKATTRHLPVYLVDMAEVLGFPLKIEKISTI